MIVEVPFYVDTFAAVKGRKSVRTAKPKTNGFDQYVWRMVRFHSGIDPTMPVVASWDFDIWYEQFDPAPKTHAYSSADEWYPHHKEWAARRDKCKEIADQYADRICDDLNLNKYSAAVRWGRALGMI